MTGPIKRGCGEVGSFDRLRMSGSVVGKAPRRPSGEGQNPVSAVDGVPIGQSQHPWFALWRRLNL